MLGPGPVRHRQLEGYFCTKHINAVALCLETKDNKDNSAKNYERGNAGGPLNYSLQPEQENKKSRSKDNKITAVNLYKLQKKNENSSCYSSLEGRHLLES